PYTTLFRSSLVVSEEVIARKTAEMFKETEEMLSWLAPSNPEEEHSKAIRALVASTGLWCMDEKFKLWADNLSTPTPIFWVTGKCKFLLFCPSECRRLLL